MSPEKVALIVVTGLIAVLSGVAILGTENGPANATPGLGKAAAQAAPAQPKPQRVLAKPIEEYTYNDLVAGRARTRTPEKAAAEAEGPKAPVEYTVKKGETLGRIAREKLGNGALAGKIVALNKGMRIDSRLQPGQKILLPPNAKLTADAGKAGATPKGKPTAKSGPSADAADDAARTPTPPPTKAKTTKRAARTTKAPATESDALRTAGPADASSGKVL